MKLSKLWKSSTWKREIILVIFSGKLSVHNCNYSLICSFESTVFSENVRNWEKAPPSGHFSKKWLAAWVSAPLKNETRTTMSHTPFQRALFLYRKNSETRKCFFYFFREKLKIFRFQILAGKIEKWANLSTFLLTRNLITVAKIAFLLKKSP